MSVDERRKIWRKERGDEIKKVERREIGYKKRKKRKDLKNKERQ